MIEVLKQAIDYIENVPDDRDNVGHIDRKALVLSLNQSIKEWESQEPLGFMNAGQVLEMQQRECPYGYVYPKQKAGSSVALYTHPPQRTWVGLTDEEIIDVIHPLVIAEMPDQATDYEIAKAIEAKLKKLNT